MTALGDVPRTHKMPQHRRLQFPLVNGRPAKGAGFLLASLATAMTLLLPEANAQQKPCCSISNVDVRNGLVSAIVKATGQAFNFKPNMPALLNSMKAGEDVYASFSTREVSLDGKTVCGTIVSIGPPKAPLPMPSARKAPSAASRLKPATAPNSGRSTTPGEANGPIAGQSLGQSSATPACCQITGVNASAGTVTAKVNTTGQTFQFKAHPQQLSTLKVGQSVFANLKAKQVSLNGTQACCQIIAFIPAVILQPLNFQKCCTMLPSGTRVLGTGPPAGEASVPGNSLPIIFYDLPSFDAQHGGAPGGLACVNTQAGHPIYVDFSASLVSQDGVTPCGYLAAAVETDYLDVLPVGIVYVPPGDPKAGLTGGVAPSQTFSSLNQTQTTTTATTVTISGQSIKVSISGPVTFTAAGSQTTSSTTTNQQQNMLSFLSQAPPASGAAGYPGTNDEVVFFLNPTYDVQYLTGYNVADPSHPYPRRIVAVTPHSAQPYEPGPQWELINAPIGELVSLTGNGQFLARDLLTAHPQAAVPMNPPSGSNIICGRPSKGGKFNPVSDPANYPSVSLTPLQSVVRRLLALDPMVYSTAPDCVPEHPERFTPITMFQDANGQQYTYGTSPIPWTYCQVPGPFGFSNTVAQTYTTINSTQSKFTSGVTMSFNPVQALAMSTGQKLDGVGASFEFGSTWEVDTTTQFQWQNQFQLTSKGQFGSGTAPYVNGSCPTNVPGFRTQLYYDWQNLSVLFWTQQAF